MSLLIIINQHISLNISIKLNVSPKLMQSMNLEFCDVSLSVTSRV